MGTLGSFKLNLENSLFSLLALNDLLRVRWPERERRNRITLVRQKEARPKSEDLGENPPNLKDRLIFTKLI